MSYGIALDDEMGRHLTPLQATDLADRDSVPVALCGSFRRDHGGLRKDYKDLVQAGCHVLSPVDVEWTTEREGFVLAAHEAHREPGDVERDHLKAMRSAYFIWLHAPDGYVGRSAAMELGYARALGLRVFARTLPEDGVLASFVTKVDSVAAVMTTVRSEAAPAPTLGLDALQRYYGRAAADRGWGEENAQECVSLLTEELGEMIGAMRKEGQGSWPAALEMADVQLYLVHLANIVGINLGQAVAEKEHINTERFASVLGRAA